MSNYDNTNKGVLFKNHEKEEGSNQPDYTGKINVDGVEKRLAAWVRTAQDSNRQFFSISVSEPYNPAAQSEDRTDPGSSASNFVDDDIPF